MPLPWCCKGWGCDTRRSGLEHRRGVQVGTGLAPGFDVRLGETRVAFADSKSAGESEVNIAVLLPCESCASGFSLARTHLKVLIFFAQFATHLLYDTDEVMDYDVRRVQELRWYLFGVSRYWPSPSDKSTPKLVPSGYKPGTQVTLTLKLGNEMTGTILFCSANQ
jgi:hypothetical protein